MAANDNHHHHHYDDDEDDDDGLIAYNEIQKELSQWGNYESASPKLRYYHEDDDDDDDEDEAKTMTTSPITTPPMAVHDYTDSNEKDVNMDDDDDEDDYDDEEFEKRPHNNRGPVGVQTPQPPPKTSQRHSHRRQQRQQQQYHHPTNNADNDSSFTLDDDERRDIQKNDNDYAYATTTMEPIRDNDNVGGGDDYDDSTTTTSTNRLYHDALFSYLQSRERILLLLPKRSSVPLVKENGEMDDDGEDDAIMGDEDEILDDTTDAALEDVDMKFLHSLGSICLSQASSAVGGEKIISNTPQKNEGNFWNLLMALRAHGLSSLFYCVNGEDVPEVTLAKEPSAMVDSAPADVLDACLGGGERGGEGACLPLRRLHAALRWIEEYHGRKFEERLDQEYQGSEDPLLPPPKRRTMWPSTLAALKKRGKTRSTAGLFHPDAPLQPVMSNHRSTSPVGVVPFSLEPQDEVDDARLLRACFMLFQAGRVEEAAKLVHDCGQPWRAVAWTGSEPLSSSGVGNPTRALWKSQCRKIATAMTKMVNTRHEASDRNETNRLYPSIAYEAAIMSLLSDNIDTAFSNPVFQTWEDGLHAILRSEIGIIEDEVLNTHNDARVDVFERGGGHFPYPGTEFHELEVHGGFQSNGGNLGAALEILEASPVERMREECGDPFRTGMTSFLVGQNAVKDYIEGCAILCFDMDDNESANFLRFITHLTLYISIVLPDFCSQMTLPPVGDAVMEENMIPLREQLVLEYVAHLSSRRDLWPHVALYSSLLSEDNILATYSSFLIHVHSEREREMTLKQARELFPAGFDCLILRSVVRDMMNSDGNDWSREPGEATAPTGVAPYYARMMRSIRWLCFYPEHSPDALVAANMLLRKFFLMAANTSSGDTPDCDMIHYSKIFIGQIFPRDVVDRCMSRSALQNLLAEYFSFETYLKSHTKYMQFLGAIKTTSPCHKSKKLVDGNQSKHETEIADKMERNAFRQKKVGLCKMIIEAAIRASDALMEVLSTAGGWLVDDEIPSDNEVLEMEEATMRSDELKEIRSSLVPKVVCMLHEVLNKTALWLEQIVHDTLAQFGDAGTDMILTLFGRFDESNRKDDDSSIVLLSNSKAAPGYWYKKALSLASVVANDNNFLLEAYDRANMESFLVLMAESHISLSRSLSLDFIQC